MSNEDFSDGSTRRVRPRGLTVICVLAIVFGALGFLAGCAGLASQLFVSRIQEAALAGQTGNTGAAAQVQQEMISRTMEVTKKYSPVMLPLILLKILVEIALIVAGSLGLALKPSGRSWLTGALTAALFLEAIQFVPTFLMQREMQTVTVELMPKMMAAQGGANGAPAGFDMSSMMSGIGTVTLVIGLLWLAAKIVLYLLGINYIRKPEVAQLF